MIFLCEGKNDIFFNHEIFINEIIINNDDIKIYLEPEELNRDIIRKKLQKISMLNFSEHGNMVKYSLSLSRQIWAYPNIHLAFGIINDEDKGDVFSYLIKLINELLLDSRKTTRIRPYLNIFKDMQRLCLSFERREEIPMWILQIPDSLEINIAKRYKKEYKDLNKEYSENDTIRKVMKKLGKSKEEIIRLSVNLFKDEIWYVNYLEKLKDNIKWSL